MTMKETAVHRPPMRGVDAEEWRVKHGLTIGLACELLGMQRAAWTKMMLDSSTPIEDMAVCILLTLYNDYPETMPIGRVVDITQFMRELDYEPKDPSDKKEFAILMGREPASTYRWVHNGNISKPIERIVAATMRLEEKSGRGSRKQQLKKIVEKVATINGISDPFERATWRNDDRPNDKPAE